MENDNQVTLPDIIKDRKKLPVVIKKDITNAIFYNCIVFIFMMIITLFINIFFEELEIEKFDSFIDIIQIFCGIISVVILEIGYRNNSGKIALFGVEFLIFSICVLFVQYMYVSIEDIDFLKYVICIFAIYYLIKSLIVFLHNRNKYLRENLSDIREIVKEEKNGYIDEESSKTLKEQRIRDEKRKLAKEEKQRKKIELINKKKNKTSDNLGGKKSD